MRSSAMAPCSLLGRRHILGEGSDEVACGVVVGHNDQLASSCAGAGRAQLCAGLPDNLREMTGAEATRLAAELVLLDLAIPRIDCFLPCKHSSEWWLSVHRLLMQSRSRQRLKSKL